MEAVLQQLLSQEIDTPDRMKSNKCDNMKYNILMRFRSLLDVRLHFLVTLYVD